jgi:hypothetical protein
VVGLVGWVVSNVSVGGFKRHTIASHSLLSSHDAEGVAELEEGQ